MSNKIIHFFIFVFLLLSFLSKEFFLLFARIHIRFFPVIYCLLSVNGCYGSTYIQRGTEKRSEISFDFQYFMSFNRKNKKSSEKCFLPIIQPPPTHISFPRQKISNREKGRERLNNILTYFQMKFNIFPQYVHSRYVLNCFWVSPKKRHMGKSMILNT